VNIADWLFNLPDAEYQRCSHAHIAAGHTTSDDGRPMSINVETIGEAFMVQHFVAQVLEPHFCRLTSTSNAITMKGQRASDSHNREEAPNLAKSIERRSLSSG